MRLLLVTSLLLLLLCTSQVLTLQCYVCADSSDTVCDQEMECGSSAVFCKTVEKDGIIKSRSCEMTCEENDDEGVSCCNQDLC